MNILQWVLQIEQEEFVWDAVEQWHTVMLSSAIYLKISETKHITDYSVKGKANNAMYFLQLLKWCFIFLSMIFTLEKL